jgi:hypothetical protein
VAILAPFVGPDSVGKLIHALLRNIDKDRFSIIPVIFTKPSAIRTEFFRTLESASENSRFIFDETYNSVYRNLLANFFEAFTFLKKGNFDLIHTHGYRADFLGLILAKLTGLPVVSTCHGFISTSTRAAFYNKIDRFVLRYFDKIIAVSDSINQELIQSGINERRMRRESSIFLRQL